MRRCQTTSLRRARTLAAESRWSARAASCFALLADSRADGVFDGGDGAWSHAELADAETDEKRSGSRVAGQLAAYRDSGPSRLLRW